MSKNKKYKLIQMLIGHFCTIGFIFLLISPLIFELTKVQKLLLIVAGIILFIFGVLCCLQFDSYFGTYICSNCGYEYQATFKQVATSHHFNSKCLLLCPRCKNKNWHKKNSN